MIHYLSRDRRLQDQLLHDTHPLPIRVHSLHFSEGSHTRLQRINRFLLRKVRQLHCLPTANPTIRGSHNKVLMYLQCRARLVSNGHIHLCQHLPHLMVLIMRVLYQSTAILSTRVSSTPCRRRTQVKLLCLVRILMALLRQQRCPLPLVSTPAAGSSPRPTLLSLNQSPRTNFRRRK